MVAMIMALVTAALATTGRVNAAARRDIRIADAVVVASDVVGRQRVLPLVVIVVVIVVIGVDRLVHVRVVRAAVLVKSVTGVVVRGRRHPVQFGVQHVVGDRGRRLVQRRPVVLQAAAAAADHGRVHRHGYSRRRFLDRVMIGPDGVLIGRHGVWRQHGAAFPSEPPEPNGRVRGQLQPDAATADPVVAAASAPDTGAPAATPASASDASAPAASVTRRPTRTGAVLGHGTVRMTRAATGTPDDRPGVPAVVEVVEMIQVVQVVQVVELMVVMVPRRNLSDLPLVMVQLLMVVMMVVVNPVRGRIERYQTLCENGNINITI